MTLRVGLGLSEAEQALTAGEGAASEALARLGATAPRLAIVLATTRYDHVELLQGIRAVTKETPLVGGSTPLLITSLGLCGEGVAILLLAADDLACTVGHHPLNGSGRSNADALVKQLLPNTERRGPRGVGLFAHHQPGLSDTWLHPFEHRLDAHTVLAGGTLAVNPQRTDAALYLNDQVFHHGVAGFCWGGGLQAGTGAAHGWHPLGTPRQITKIDGTSIHSLEGAPAARLYRTMFGDEAVQQTAGEMLPRMTVTYPLGITMGARSSQVLVRSVQHIDAQGALQCLSEVPIGGRARLMIASHESVINAATHAASLAKGRLRQVSCALILESWSRYRMLGSQLATELMTVRRVLGPQVPILGGLTLAEAVPRYHSLSHVEADVQNNMMLVIALGQ